jgi:anti-sigma regulatory factor (Ser/Thr protein kinase)
VPGRDGDRQQATFAASASGPRRARAFTTESLQRIGAPDDIVVDLTLVASELFTNFVEHSDGRQIEVVVDATDRRWWELAVIGGIGAPPKRVPDPGTWTVAAMEQISGRGLGIVRRLVDDVALDDDGGRVRIRCRIRRDADRGRSG